MSLLISSTNVPAYAYFSQGTGVTPISATATLDGLGGTIDSDVKTVYLIATTFNYTAITVAPITETDAGINWQISLDNITYGETVSPTAMDATATDKVTTLYLKAVNTNDGSIVTGVYTGADVQISATENP